MADPDHLRSPYLLHPSWIPAEQPGKPQQRGFPGQLALTNVGQSLQQRQVAAAVETERSSGAELEGVLFRRRTMELEAGVLLLMVLLLTEFEAGVMFLRRFVMEFIVGEAGVELLMVAVVC